MRELTGPCVPLYADLHVEVVFDTDHHPPLPVDFLRQGASEEIILWQHHLNVLDVS